MEKNEKKTSGESLRKRQVEKTYGEDEWRKKNGDEWRKKNADEWRKRNVDEWRKPEGDE